jgi:hypothetical protein
MAKTDARQRERLFKVWVAYETADSPAGRRELAREVIAPEALRALQAALRGLDGINAVVVTIEQVSILEEALRHSENN